MAFAWYRGLERKQKNAFWAAFAGWGLDAMDTQIYAISIPVLLVALPLTKTQAGTIGTTVLVFASLGGWLAGVASDRFGRVRVLQAAIIWFATFTCLSGFANSFHQLLVIRSLQGVGFGGEWAVGAVLVSETVGPSVRGRAVGSINAGFGVGYALAVVLSAAIFAVAPPRLAWRLLFFAGLLPILMVFFIRRTVEEPGIFLRDIERRSAAKIAASSPLEIFTKRHLPRTAIASFVAICLQGGNYSITIWLPTYLRTVLHLTMNSASLYLLVLIAGMISGSLTCAEMSDVIGRRRCFMICVSGLAAVLAVYTLAPIAPWMTLVLGYFIGAFQSAAAAVLGPWFSELFPTDIRATAQGFIGNVGRCVGAVAPLAIGILAATLPLGLAIASCAISCYVVAFLLVLWLPETTGLDLETISSGRLEQAPARSAMVHPYRADASR